MTLTEIELTSRVVDAFIEEDGNSIVRRFDWLESLCRLADRLRRGNDYSTG